MGRPRAGGDANRGRSLIRAYGCHTCHTVPGVVGADAVVGPPLNSWASRQFIQRVAAAGGADATYHGMLALGLMAESSYKPLKLQGQGNGRRVVILGAGLAGMCAAFELNKLGYACIILEARNRAGGRCWTVRRGTDETEVTGARQVCEFDQGL